MTKFASIPTKSNLQNSPAQDTSNETEKYEYQNIVLKLSNLTKKYQDNLNKENLQEKQINQILQRLLINLENPSTTDKTKIREFYDFLNSRHPKAGIKNIDVIQQDENISASKFILGTFFIMASIMTGVFPFILIVSGLVYLATDRSLFDIFNTNGEQYAKEVTLVEARDLKKYGVFFNPAPPTEEEETDLPFMGIKI
ncbi:hypothetical protein Lnau_3084 [Legionella nautarum]|uniref:Uncharacterized protein n=1 Tax=Legionella nautarum TaxID=45070 RepID=A0A0W0WIL5_9GAMM|nr:hypothetical protein [Legionella nautarum]KTD32173.1 hypothetical protein Lnau_3084 [Legionella nautarum]